MHLRMSHDKLMEALRRHGLSSREHQQVRRRLLSLLPNRLRDLKRQHQTAGISATAAERQALSDPQYLAAIEEYTQILQDGLTAQIQFETHMMLLDARRSLRAFRK